MADAVPSALKPIKPFLLRASEVEASGHESAKVVAYYCKAYAVQKAIDLGVIKEPGVEKYLLGLMDKLESDKQGMSVTRDEGKEIVKNFSLGVFKKADDEYRAGLATKGTARSFYAAGSFLEVNHHFADDGSPVDPKIDNLRKYAKVKATEILLALKQGKKPLPPDMVEEEAGMKEQEDEESDEEPQPIRPTSPAKKEPAKPKEPAKSRESPKVNQEPAVEKKRRQTQLAPRGTGGTEETKKAEGFARQAIRALQKEQCQTAAENISGALSLLESTNPKPVIDAANITSVQRNDALEYVFFAVRSLECIGAQIELDDGIDLAVNHLSEALRILES